tara:strand:+ start:302 stop:409 length:108 start_codon:yes stop_codon:yes gene_type:complete
MNDKDNPPIIVIKNTDKIISNPGIAKGRWLFGFKS